VNKSSKITAPCDLRHEFQTDVQIKSGTENHDDHRNSAGNASEPVNKSVKWLHGGLVWCVEAVVTTLRFFRTNELEPKLRNHRVTKSRTAL